MHCKGCINVPFDFLWTAIFGGLFEEFHHTHKLVPIIFIVGCDSDGRISNCRVDIGPSPLAQEPSRAMVFWNCSAFFLERLGLDSWSLKRISSHGEATLAPSNSSLGKLSIVQPRVPPEIRRLGHWQSNPISCRGSHGPNLELFWLFQWIHIYPWPTEWIQSLL